MAEQDYACVGRGCQRAAMQTEIERLRAERAQQTKDEERLRYAIEIGAGTLRRLRAALEDVRERVQEIANRYHEQHFVIDTVARLLCETIPAALAGDAKHEVVRLGDGATYCPGCTVTFPVEIGPVVAGSGENIAGTFTVGPVVPASEPRAFPDVLMCVDCKATIPRGSAGLHRWDYVVFGTDDDAEGEWMCPHCHAKLRAEIASEQPNEATAWSCDECGKVHAEWAPKCERCEKRHPDHLRGADQPAGGHSK